MLLAALMMVVLASSSKHWIMVVQAMLDMPFVLLPDDMTGLSQCEAGKGRCLRDSGKREEENFSGMRSIAT